MVRSIYYGPHFGEKLTEICSKGSGTGLVLGSVNEDRVFGVCLVETPKEEPEGEADEAKKEQVLDVTWMLEHAKQVYRLMPGNTNKSLISSIYSKIFRWLNNFGMLHIP